MTAEGKIQKYAKKKKKRFELIVASDGNKYRVMRWRQLARRPRYYWIRGEQLSLKHQ